MVGELEVMISVDLKFSVGSTTTTGGIISITYFLWGICFCLDVFGCCCAGWAEMIWMVSIVDGCCLMGGGRRLVRLQCLMGPWVLALLWLQTRLWGWWASGCFRIQSHESVPECSLQGNYGGLEFPKGTFFNLLRRLVFCLFTVTICWISPTLILASCFSTVSLDLQLTSDSVSFVFFRGRYDNVSEIYLGLDRSNKCRRPPDS